MLKDLLSFALTLSLAFPVAVHAAISYPAVSHSVPVTLFVGILLAPGAIASFSHTISLTLTVLDPASVAVPIAATGIDVSNDFLDTCPRTSRLCGAAVSSITSDKYPGVTCAEAMLITLYHWESTSSLH